jgi:hypothetical protein
MMTVTTPAISIIRQPLNVGIASSLAKQYEHNAAHVPQGYSTMSSSINYIDVNVWITKVYKGGGA